MSLYPESNANTFTAQEQSNPDTAVLADGSYVTVWQSYDQDANNSWGVYYQRFSASGVPIGGEFRANTATAGGQTNAHVAATSDGGFVILWDDDNGLDGASQGVYGQRFNGGGVAQGSQFLVNTTTASTQYQNAVAGYTGGFATTWVSYTNNNYDIYLQRWDNTGAKVGGETLVSKTTGAATAQPGTQEAPDIAARANGDLVMVWTDHNGSDGSGYGVYGRTYTASSGVYSDTFLVNTTTSSTQYEPSVALLSGGGFVVVWRSDSQDGSSAGVYGQRFDAAGAKAGSEFLVNQSTNGGQYQPSITGLSTGGFVVAFYNDNYDVADNSSYQDVYVREYGATGIPLGNQTKLTAPGYAYDTESTPVVTDLGNGNYVVSYSNYIRATDGGNNTYEVSQQIFGSAATLPRQSDPHMANFSGSVTFGENLVNATPQVIRAVVGLSDTDSANFDGGQIDLYYVQNGDASDQLGVRSVGTGANQISVSGSTILYEGVAIGSISGGSGHGSGSNGSNLVITLNAAATVDAVEELVQNLTYANTSSSPAATRTLGIRISDGDGGSSTASTIDIHVTPEVDGAPVVYGESQVNTFTGNTQSAPQIAVLADGSYVIVWQSYDQDANNTWGVYGQHFTAQGVAIGAEFRVNTATAAAQDGAHVAALSNGGFVVTWDDASGVDGNGQGVMAQRYNSTGVAQGGNFVANTYTSNTQQYSDVAGYAGAGAVVGGFATVWASNGNTGGSSYDIYLQRFDNSGAKLGTELRVSTTPGAATAQTSNQFVPRIAAQSNGDLVVVWRDDGGNDGGGSYGIYAQRYTAATGTLSGSFLVNTEVAGNQYEPDVATLSDGGFVVVWRSDSQDGSSAGVYGQRYSAAGTAVGGEFRVNESTTGGQYQPSVTGLSTGGFVVSFYNDNYDTTATGSSADVYIREYDASGMAIDGQRKLPSATATGSNQESDPAIADLGNGNFVVAYADYVPTVDGGNATYEITQQIFGSAAALARQQNPTLGDFTGTVTFGENLVNTTPQTIDAAVSLTDLDSANFAGGRLDLFYVQNGDATDQLGVRHQGSAAGQIGVSGTTISYGGATIGTLGGGSNGTALQVTLTAAATVEAVEALIQNLTYASTSSSPTATRTVGIRVSDGDGGSSNSSTVDIHVTPELDGAPVVYGESQVNTFTTNTQSTPQIAVLADGSYVIVWQSYDQDANNTWGVYGQHFTAQGVAIGAEFRANTATTANQEAPHVAALGNGGFVITWDDGGSVDGSGQGVIGQLYSSAGATVGANFVANTTTSSSQQYSDVAGYAGAGAVVGGFATVWASTGNTGGNGYDIYLQRFDNSGAKLGGEVRLSTTPGAATAQSGQQYYPRIAAQSNGDLVIVWRDDNGNDTSGYGVYARTYTAASNTYSDTFLVNSYLTGSQYEPDVATLSDGGFVVVWRSDTQDGSSAGVYGQRYSAAGAKVGAEFMVNETTTGGQYQPSVTGLSTGGFVVSFYNDNYDTTGAGSYSDIYIREYDASGVAIDGQRKLPSATATGSNTEAEPAIADLGNGNFVVAYTDHVPAVDGGNATYEITQQIFGSAAALARQQSPTLGDFTGTVTFDENLLNTTPQIIDAAVSLTDLDSANFAGGRLDLFYVQNGEATDQLGVRHQGGAAGQIGVSGATISYGGATIGTLVGGSNGAALQVTLTATATVEAVEALIQNLTYASTSSSPVATRTVAIRVSDGDGGSSNSSTVEIHVTPGLDGIPVVYGESQVNTFTGNTQSEPDIAVLADGSYVIVWQSYDQDANSTWGVYGQHFTAQGVAIGTEFRVNSATIANQEGAHVAALSNGGFVVTWDDTSGVDGNGQGVMGQLYSSTGATVGTNFVANTTTNSVQYQSTVAGYTGGFATSWISNTNAGGNGYDVVLQRWDNAGAKVGAEVLVGKTPGAATAQAGTQQTPEIAAHANGNLVVVWADHNGNDSSSYGVYARTYTAASNTYSDTFLVNSYLTGAQYEPDVATLSDGGFVVVWRSDSQDGNSTGVFGQRYSAAGAQVGAEFMVNESTAGGQYQPSVTGLSTGGFVVSFYNDNYDSTGTGSYNDVYIREYDASGVAIDGQRKLPSATATGSNQEYQPAIADLGNGNFVVAYADHVPTVDGGNATYEITQQIFGSAAELVRSSANPVLGDVQAQRILTNNAADALYAGNAQVLDTDVSVVDADSANLAGGTLVVSILSGGSASDVLGIRNQGTGGAQIGVSGNDVSYGGVVIGSFTGGGAGASTLTITFNANALTVDIRALVQNITYQNTAPPAGTTSRTIGLRLTDGDGGASAPEAIELLIQNSYNPATVALDDVAATVSMTEAQANAGVLLDNAVQLNYAGATGFLNGHLSVSYLGASNRVDDQLVVRNQGTGSNQVSRSGTDILFEGISIGTVSSTLNGANGATLDITFKASATAHSIERVIENLVYSNPSSGPLASREIRVVVTDGAGAASAARDIDIHIDASTAPGVAIPLLGEQQVNTYEGGQQTAPAVARLQGSNNGGYVVTWTSQEGQDGSGYGVFAQRYDASGAASGPEFQVNSYTNGSQTDVAVAGLANGGYVIVWRSDNQDGSGYGVYGQRYAANGSAVGSEFRATTTSTSNQYEPSVLGLADGSFVVSYRSDYSDAVATYPYDVLAQRFAADGSPLGGETTLNASGGATQFQPQLSALAGGGYVAVWTDTSGDASGYGIVAQIFNNDGSKVGAQVAVNTSTTGNQEGPDVVGLAGGGFVAVWEYADTIYLQRFTAAGVAVGGETKVNSADFPSNYNNYARVAALETGGFIVTWDGYPAAAQGGSNIDVMAQQFDDSGNKVDGVRIVNSSTASTQYLPDIVGLTGGNAVVVWAGYNQEYGTANTYGVFQQILGAAGSVASSSAPVLVDLVETLSFNENLVNTAPQTIDAGVSLTDADSANFAGGRLWVSVVSGYGAQEAAQLVDGLPAQDQFGIRNQGTGAGQVAVGGSGVGSEVRYGNVVVGSIEATGSNGADLVVLFNASASAQAVEAVIENLTYANTSSSPVASRTVSISVNDGDGGTSIARTVTITVNPEADGAQPLFGNAAVNTYPDGSKSAPASAALADGGYITTWVSTGQDGWDNGVYAQRYDSQGVPVGAEFRVNSTTAYNQTEPTVVGLGGGGYVVAWTSANQDGSGLGIYAQRFANDGTLLGGEFQVNTVTYQGQSSPSLAATADGGFVVGWQGDYYNETFTDYRDIFFQRFNAAGVAQGSETQANPTGEGTVTQEQPSFVGLAGGGFIALWSDSSKDGGGYGVYGQRFDASGTASGAAFLVNTTTSGGQSQPDITALNDGGFVVVWTSDAAQDGSSYGVYGQRYSSSGALVGGEFRVNTTTSGNQYSPTVAALSHGGFVVGWNSNSTTIVQQFDASGARIDGEVRVDTADNNSNAATPTVVGLADGAFAVTWADHDYSISNSRIYQQVLGDPATLTRQADPELVDISSSVTFAENAVNAAPQLIDAEVGLNDLDSANFAGGMLEVNYLTGYDLQNQLGLQGLATQDQLGLRSQGSAAGQIGIVGSSVRYGGVEIGTITHDGVNGSKLTVLFNANATVASVEKVVESITYANPLSDASLERNISIRVSDGDGGASKAHAVTIHVTPEYDAAQPLFSNEQVNTFEPGTQGAPAMALLSDGSYLTVWSSEAQDGWGTGVYAQRFAANGVPIGTEFQVNTYTPTNQSEPTVVGLAGGGYVVAWTSANQDSSGAGIYAQRFANDGTLLGDEFLVNSETNQGQSNPSLAATADGGFVVGWQGDYYNTSFTEYRDIFFQRFNAAGVAQGSETQANPTGEGLVTQEQPRFVGLAGGGFVALWTDHSKDGAIYGVYGQRFDASGTASGAAFLVNTTTSGGQSEPSATALNDGGFVVVWTSDSGQDGSGYGVYGQRFSSSGALVGSEFRVNTTTSGNQYQASVASLSTGGFVVTWNYDSRTMAQQFDASGARLDGEVRLDTQDNQNNASVPVVLGLANGGFVASWPDYNYTTSNYNVYQQLYGNPAQTVRQANPELVDVSPSVTFAENLVNAAPQLIDAGVGLLDTDSSNFAGGILEINYLTDYGAQDQLGLQGLDNQDQLGIRHQGSGAHQVGVAGHVVSYGGVEIGSIVSNGANGGKLTVQFNASATGDAVEHVIENLTYANTVSNPIASRTISIRVTDGDGGASTPRNVEIIVTPEIDGAVRFGQEKVVNTTVAGQQQDPSISRLSDGGYVVVWEDQGGADGGGYGVYGQRYDVNDNAVGGQFRANTFTNSNQYEAQVTGLNGGGFVVVWRSDNQDGSGLGVYGQRYNAAGVAEGTEFKVNTSTDQNQYQPTLTATADGGFVVGWYDDYYTNAGNTEYRDILFQRYNATGVAQGAETRANPAGEGTTSQYEPSFTALAGGGFMAVWADASKDGDGSGIYGQRFTALGVAAGPAVQINAYITSTQDLPAVAGLKDGGFIAVWQSWGQDLSGTGIYAQRFDAAGAKVGAEFRVNSHIDSEQLQPSVTALENGGWVVGWTDFNGPGGGNYDVYVQQYSASGLPVDGQTLVNSYTYQHQSQPSITSMADGGFVVAYTSYITAGDGNGDGTPDGGNDTTEIRTQRFSNTAPDVSDVVAVGQEEAVLVLTNTLFEGGFEDPDGQSLQAIKIITLPAEGALRLHGVAVTTNQEISLADLQAGALTYQGRTDYFGADQFRWTGSDGITFASTPVFTNILLSNVNDGPRLGALTSATGSEGSFFSRTLSIGDPDPEGHQITVDWGDGSAHSVFATSAANPQIQHVYADNGSYTVNVTVNDQQGQANSSESTSFSVAIANVAPTIGMSGNPTVEQNLVYSLDLHGVSDPGSDTVDQYTIDWGDGSAPQVIAASALPANGILTHSYATTGAKTIVVGLRDEDGSYSNAGSKTITVSAPAEVITVDAGGDIATTEGSSFSKTISFNDPTDQGTPGRTYTAVWGDGSTSTGGIAAGASSFNISHAYADNGGPYAVNVTVHDNDGAILQEGSDSFNVTVNNAAPSVGLGGAGSVQEGSVYTLTLHPSDPGTDTITQYVIHWGDGTDQTVLAANLPANRQLTHTYTDGNATRSITVDVVDEDGSFTNIGQGGSVFVANVAPLAPVTGANTVDEGSPYTLNVGTVTDPGADTRTGYSISWGDGSPNTNLTPAEWATAQLAGGNFTHTYADGAGAGTARNITVTASDEDGTFVLGSKTITINNVAPSALLAGASSTNEGASYSLNIAASDVAGVADPLTYSIDWGDGSAVQTLTAGELAALAGNVAHVFTDDADGAVNSTPRTISVTADDGDGGLTTVTKVVSVDNVAPTAVVTGANSVDEASVYTLNVAAVADPGADTRTGYTISWGDGETSSFTAAQWAAAAGSFTHTYADNAASSTITVSATDEDGTFVLGSKTIAINNVAPSAMLAGASSTNEGASYSLNITASDVAGAADPLTYSIDWGDGSAVQTLTAVQLAALAGNVSHVFTDDADGAVNSTPRTISVTADDGDGGITTVTKVVNVDNVAPTAVVSGANSVDEASVYTLSVAAVADPGADTRTGYTISWGDGETSSFTAAQWAAAAGSFTHTYVDNAASSTITVSTTDEDGTFMLGSKTIAIHNVAPSALLAGASSTNEGASYSLNIAASDVAGAADPLTYSIDWGDGSAVQTLTAGELAALSGNVAHVFTDDVDGAINSTTRTISVTADDGDGGTTTVTKSVNVDNVAPTIAVSGASTIETGQTYTLNLGAVTDPGVDTVSAYTIDWGDGSALVVATAGNVTHTFASAGVRTVLVSLTDEDGTYTNVASVAVTVGTPPATVSIEAGADSALDEGGTLARSINFADSTDNGAAGWSYSIDYGDGSAAVTGTTLVKTIDLSHVYTDGSANRTVSVSVTDVNGETATDSFQVSVDNVAPTAVVTGANSLDEASVYTLSVAAVADPGADTRTGYTIAWGDGETSSFTAAQWLAAQLAGGSFTHTYADNAASSTITVSTTDEDGTFVLGSKTIAINNVAPSALLAGANSTNEGAIYSLNIAASDVAGAADPLTYSIDWGDGSAVQTLTAVQLAALAGNVSHVFTDDADGAVNSTPRTISVTADDGDGGITTVTKVVNVDNVAPTATVSGAGNTVAGNAYTLDVGSLADPGQDTAIGYSIDWGDGTVAQFTAAQWAAAAGSFLHTYGTASTSANIVVRATDEDGTFDLGSQHVTIDAPQQVQTLRLGDAPDRQSGVGNQWALAWNNADVAIQHKADYSSTLEAWSAAKFTGISPQALAGGDIYTGDLGVSGQSQATSSVRQELDGTEALRFRLTDPADHATEMTLYLSRLFAQDDGTAFVESGRVRLLNASGAVVGETSFHADSASGLQQVTLAAAGGFNTVELTAGVYQGGDFIYGGYAQTDGSFGSGITSVGGLHGSDFMVEAIEFKLPVLGVE